jgi:hypothetical protein
VKGRGNGEGKTNVEKTWRKKKIVKAKKTTMKRKNNSIQVMRSGWAGELGEKGDARAWCRG